MKKTIIALSALLISLILTGCNDTASTNTSPAAPSVFDWSFYVNYNKDLLSNGINDSQKAIVHWTTTGLKAGLQSKADFSVKDYLDLNPDLKKTFGPTNYEAALYHYLTTGYKENRRTIRVPYTKVFDWYYYIHSSPGLAEAGITTEQTAFAHWAQIGIKEGRRSSPSFSVKDYLELNPEISNIVNNNYEAAIEHYLSSGCEQNLKTIKPNSFYSIKDKDDYYVGNEVVRIKSSGVYAGTISGMNVRGKEIANDHDAGRLIQTALSYDNRGECDNPTEGGAAGELNKSSSVLLARNMSNNSLSTQSRAANWLSAGKQSAYCPGGVSTVPTVSDTIIQKDIRLGAYGDPNLIEWNTSISVPAAHNYMSVEGLTGYHDASLNTFYKLELSSLSLTPLKTITFENPDWSLINSLYPIIISTPDGKTAVGAWAEDFSQYEQTNGTSQIRPRIFPKGGGFTLYTPSKWSEKTSKWSWSYAFTNAPAGVYHFRIILGVGTLEEVKQSFIKLVRENKNQQIIPFAFLPNGKTFFSPEFYADHYPDLKSAFGYNPDLLFSHYLNYGANEGRIASADFNFSQYKLDNPEMSNYYNNDMNWIIWHWLTH